MEQRLDPFQNEMNMQDIASLQTASDTQNKTTLDSAAKAPSKKSKQLGDATMTGEPADQVVINPNHDPAKIVESADSTAVMAFGRMNPPTVGHEKLIHKVEDVAKEHKGQAHIVASHSEGTGKDPLPQKAKIGYIKKVASKGTVVSGSSKEAPTIMHAAANLHKQGHKHLVVVAGEDRVNEYHKLLHKYNNVEGKHGHYNFKSIKVVSAGHRDPDAEGTEGMSGTKMRSLAREGKHEEFKSGLPKSLHKHAEEIANHIRSVKEEIELDETASLEVRQHRANTMKRNKAKLARARQLARKRIARTSQMHRRALKRARAQMRARISGHRGESYRKLSSSDKIAIDRLADKHEKQIQSMAKKLAGKLRRNDIVRVQTGKGSGKVPVVADFQMDMNAMLSEKATKALHNKAAKAGVTFEQISEVYASGISDYPTDSKLTPQQFAFNRVNSFMAEAREAVMTPRMVDTQADKDDAIPLALPKKLRDLTSLNQRRRHKQMEVQKKVIDENSVFKRAANKIVRRQSPQLDQIKKNIVNSLKDKKYEELANTILYLFRDKMGGNKRVNQE